MSKTATREAYGKALAGLISKRKDIIVLDADLSKSTKTSEAKAVCPNQHFNMGIAEANMMGGSSRTCGEWKNRIRIQLCDVCGRQSL